MTSIAGIIGAFEAGKAIVKRVEVLVRGVLVSLLALLDPIELQEVLVRFFRQQTPGGIDTIVY